MRVGVPKEIKVLENRVGLVPGSVRELVAHGHQVVVERSAGEGIGMDDDTYRKAGATVKYWRSNQARTGAEGERMAQELDDFLNSIDIAVVGLGNCGSCTGWTIRDALAAADKGLPTTAICTQVFEELGHNLASAGGRSGLRIHILPYPLNEKLREDVDPVAYEHLESVLKTMGAELTTAMEAAV